MKVTCKACGKHYDYHQCGCCPECGAYNRPPRKEQVDADGTVHHISEQEFWENGKARHKSQSGKVCFEEKPHVHVPANEPDVDEDLDVEKVDMEPDDTPDAWAYEEDYGEDEAYGNDDACHTVPSSGGRLNAEDLDFKNLKNKAKRYTNNHKSYLPILILVAAIILLAVVGIIISSASHALQDAIENIREPRASIEEVYPQEDAQPELSELTAVDAIEEDLVDAAYEAEIGDSFLWWDDVTRVERSYIEYLPGNGAEVTVELYQENPGMIPDLYYTSFALSEDMGFYGEMMEETQDGNYYTYKFDAFAADEGSEFYLVCTGFNGDDYVEIRIPLY